MPLVSEARMHDLNDEQIWKLFLLLKIMCNVKHGPVCLGPAVQLCGMAGGDFFKLPDLQTSVTQLPADLRNVFSL